MPGARARPIYTVAGAKPLQPAVLTFRGTGREPKLRGMDVAAMESRSSPASPESPTKEGA